MQAKMAKLQLYINKSQRGYKNLVNINPAEDINRYIHDYRKAVEDVGYDTSKEYTFYLLSYVAEGTLLTVLRTIAGASAGDHVAATLFFAAGTVIDDHSIRRILTAVRDSIADGGRALTPEALGDLRDMLAADYAVDNDAPRRLPSTGKLYACCYYGGKEPSAVSFISARYYMPALAEYAGVLMIDSTCGARFRNSERDLSAGSIRPSAVLLPPPRTAQGFTPHIYRHPFTRALIVPAGEAIEIQWKRGGFETVSQTVKAAEGESVAVTPPDTSKALKCISPASFYVTEQGSQSAIDTFVIKVNGKVIDSPQSFTFAELANAHVEITSPGYFSFTGSLDLASTTQALVQMKQLHRTYRFDLPVNTPEPVEAIRIYLKTKKPITNCPIEGYSVAGDEIVEGTGVCNNLVYTGGHSRRSLYICGVVAALSLLAGIFIGWLAFDVENEARTSHTPVEAIEYTTPQSEPEPAAAPEPAAEAPAPAETAPAAPTAEAIAAAVAYLDSNKQWERGKMEETGVLHELFDDLNNYNFDIILTKWAPLLSDSKNFDAVVRAVKGSASKRSPRTAPHDPVYVSGDTDAIGWRQYTYWVDP